MQKRSHESSDDIMMIMIRCICSNALTIKVRLCREETRLSWFHGFFINSQVLTTTIFLSFSQNFATALTARFLWGLLNGNVGVAKTYLSEVSQYNVYTVCISSLLL